MVNMLMKILKLDLMLIGVVVVGMVEVSLKAKNVFLLNFFFVFLFLGLQRPTLFNKIKLLEIIDEKGEEEDDESWSDGRRPPPPPPSTQEKIGGNFGRLNLFYTCFLHVFFQIFFCYFS